MVLQCIHGNFTVSKVADFSKVDLNSSYCFIGSSDEEKSLVCMSENTPDNITEREDGWKAFRIQGTLDFSLIGILARISTILTENQIGIFVVSTFNTDYIFTKEENYAKALMLLEDAGYQIQ